MFNLNETFKQGYELFLREQAEADFDKAFTNLEECQKEADESFRVIQEYFSFYALSENLQETPNMTSGSKPGEGEKDDNKTKDTRDSGNKGYSDDNYKAGMETVTGLLSMLGRSIKDTSDYDPVVGNVTIKKFSEMKFPQNILFFIQSLVSWLVNLVRKFISFLTQGIQRLFSLPVASDFKGDLKPHFFEKASGIESISIPAILAKTTEPKAAAMVSVGTTDIERIRSLLDLQESVELNEQKNDINDVNNPEHANFKKEEYALKIDINKEMEDLHQALIHFLDLFDNAYGSNQEHLFDIEDLHMLLELFKATIASVAELRMPNYAIGGTLTDIEVLNKEKLKDNLIRTKINTDTLKRAFVETENKINTILQIITQKQLLGAGSLGVAFKFYSAATYMQMKKIIDVLNPRIKESARLETRLKKMGDTFNRIVVELGKQRTSLINYGPIAYQSVYQRKVNDLFDSARFASQTITLRLGLLGVYIKQLKDVKEAILNANAINSRSKSILKLSAFKF